MIENYKHKFTARGKFIFVPNSICDQKGARLLEFGSQLDLPDYFYHYRKGGHVAALHRHIENTHFFRIDLKNFFYSISRNRVSRVLRQYDFPGNARTYAEWSTVQNPYPNGPRFVLPIGFCQSPLLASLTLYRSSVAAAIEEASHRNVFVSVYFDDLIGSSRDANELKTTYDGILAAVQQANLVTNPEKLTPPAEAIVAFKCDLSHGKTEVTAERVDEFFQVDRSMAAIGAFEAYRDRVTRANHHDAD